MFSKRRSKAVVMLTLTITLLAIIPIRNILTSMSSDIMMPQKTEAIQTQNVLEEQTEATELIRKEIIKFNVEQNTLNLLIMRRFKEEWIENNYKPSEAIFITLQSSGKAIFAAAITTIGAFAIIGFSNSPMLVSFGWLTMLVSFGWLTMLVITISLIAALVLLPIILVRYATLKDSNKPAKISV